MLRISRLSRAPPPAWDFGVEEVGECELDGADNEEAVAGQADETRGEGAANEESEDESWATSEDTSEDASEGDGVDESEDESMALDGMPENIPSATYDKNDPPMIVGSIYPNIDEFRLAIAQHAIKKEFEFNIIRSEPGQYTAKCAAQGCNWRIHASVVADGVTMIVKTNPFPHECSSTRRSETIKATSKFWICEKVKDWLLEDASVGAKELQRRIHETHKVKINYKRVHAGRELAITKLYDSWRESFDMLYRYKAQVEKASPGSFFIIDHHTVLEEIKFIRLFFALKPCIHGFLTGCRPYLAIDSTFLTGKFKGQLAVACAVDGHNWMYPVALGIFDSDSVENWMWFMQQLKDAIGTPRGLALCTDAGKGIDSAVHEVFRNAEHRECMKHMVTNFKKKFTGKIFDDNLWPAAYAWSPYFYEKHMAAMEEAKPEAVAYLRKYHKRLWSRSQFSTVCKVDYVTNNLAESFNNLVKDWKALHLYDFLERIRRWLLVKWDKRQRIGKKFEGRILPHIVKELNEKSRDLDMVVTRNGDFEAEIEVKGGSGFRHVVNLEHKTCTCREFQVSGKPCIHAIAFITSIRGRLEDYVDDCFSVHRFRAAYEKLIPSLPDKSQWPQADHGFFLAPPILK
ncbi:protein FAR-RED IMPAIRED RESPONSE 1 [Oryza sativa Japonica Group]|uniref:protein FAR-RED IMPAIRED RESPONSE 1 n=1 Tax=Oryza sativa subsp. japonica TaxID=39947 RepID=UPI00339BF892